MQNYPGITSAELAEPPAQDGIVENSPTIVGQASDSLGVTRKKFLHVCECDTPEVCQACEDYRCAGGRIRSRAPDVGRVVDAVPENYGANVTTLGALSCRGLAAVMTVDGATDASVFRTFVNRGLVPALRPGISWS